MRIFVKIIILYVTILPQLFGQNTSAINIKSLKWLPNSHTFWTYENGGIFINDVENLSAKSLVIEQSKIEKAGLQTGIEDIVWSNDLKGILIYTNSSRVWRENTKGDYWYFDLNTGLGRQVGKGLESSSLKFAKFSPDNKNIAYVSKNNLYVENTKDGLKKQLTKDGTDRIINGTFDWAYEEELGIRDGFLWSPDSKKIAYWQIDASQVRNHKIINNTDSLYPFIIDVEYPKAGDKPSAAKIGCVDIASAKTTWMNIPGESNSNYIPRMDWASANQLLAVQLNRNQNKATFYKCEAKTGAAAEIYKEEVANGWIALFNAMGWDDPWWLWIDNKQSFLRTHEKDGWMRITIVSSDGKTIETLTTGNFDANLLAYNQETRDIYFEASPYDATQRYLYRLNIDTKDTVRVTPSVFDGTNTYRFSTDSKYALHKNGSIKNSFSYRLISLPDHEKIYPLGEEQIIPAKLGFDLEKFSIKTIDNVDIDGIMAKPLDFDSHKKYPVFFFVYGEPASSVANDVPYFNGFIANLVPRGYIGIAMDNRGTPVYKGTKYRMDIYKKIGVINARDQAMAAKEILKWPFIDTSRVAVHGWSGGGNMTLNLMFQYPEIYKVGVAVSSVTDQHFYDNIYTERFMGLPQDDEASYKASSPVTYAKNLQGKLLYMHGTGDDNVHYKNAEVLINELISQGKLFEFMAYPNRTHGIYEGKGTSKHVANTFWNFIERNCPPGGR